MSYEMDDLNVEVKIEPKEKKNRALGVGTIISLILVFSIGLGIGAAVWSVTHTFPIPPTGQPISNMAFPNLIFKLGIGNTTPLNAGNFSPTSDTAPTAYYTLSGASGLTIYMIALEKSSCVDSPITNIIKTSSGVLNPGLKANTLYNYCIYYSSGPSIANGTLIVSYSG